LSVQAFNIKPYTLIVIGSGAAGMMAAITAARQGKSVLLLEKLSKIGAKPQKVI